MEPRFCTCWGQLSSLETGVQREALVGLTWLLRDPPICPDLSDAPKLLTIHYTHTQAVFGVNKTNSTPSHFSEDMNDKILRRWAQRTERGIEQGESCPYKEDIWTRRGGTRL